MVHIHQEKMHFTTLSQADPQQRREVLEAIYEQDFMDCSYGFRPGRSAHDAIRTLDQIVHRGEVNWILEADIVSYLKTFTDNYPVWGNREGRRDPNVPKGTASPFVHQTPRGWRGRR